MTGIQDDLATLHIWADYQGRDDVRETLRRAEAELARLDEALCEMTMERGRWQERAVRNRDEVARLKDGLGVLVTLVRIGFLVTVDGERATAEFVNEAKARAMLFVILQAEDVEAAVRALLAEDGAARLPGENGWNYPPPEDAVQP